MRDNWVSIPSNQGNIPTRIPVCWVARISVSVSSKPGSHSYNYIPDTASAHSWSQTLLNREIIPTDKTSRRVRRIASIPSKQGDHSDDTVNTHSCQCKFQSLWIGKSFRCCSVSRTTRAIQVTIPSKRGSLSDFNKLPEVLYAIASQSLQNRESLSDAICLNNLLHFLRLNPFKTEKVFPTLNLVNLRN